MNQKRKKILAILLIVIVLLLGVAAVFVTLKLQTAPVPTAPTSVPQAAEWFGGGACNVSFTIPTPGVLTCTSKEIYRDVAANTAGTYDTSAANLLAANEKLVPGSQYVYLMNYSNSGQTSVDGVVTDVLNNNLTFIDSGTRGSYNTTTRTVTFNITGVAAGTTTRSAFRVRVNANASGTISNTASIAGSNTCAVSNPLAAPAVSCDSKEAYQNIDTNTAGNYNFDTVITAVGQDGTFVYGIKVKNAGDAPASNVTITDVLTGDNQNSLTYLDGSTGCNYAGASKTVTCTIASIAAGATEMRAFRVKVSNAAANGQVIKNTATVTFGGNTSTCAKDVTISGVVSCNNTCTTDAECSTGLVCSSGSCRNSSCTEQSSCVCPTPTPTATETPTPTTTVTPTPTTTGTAAPTTVAPTTTTTVTGTAAPTTVAPTTTTTVTGTAAPTATGLPKAGVLNLPGAAAFGGGLLLTVLGILFAL